MKTIRTTNRTRRQLMVVLAAPLIVSGFAVHRPARAAQTKTEQRDVSGFNEVLFDSVGELRIEQGGSESLSIEAEPDVLSKITSRVEGKRLVLGMSSGRVVAREPIVFRLQVRELRRLEMRSAGEARLAALDAGSLALVVSGSGDIDCENITAKKLDVRVPGSGSVSLAGGRADSLHIAIGGSGTVDAGGVTSQTAEASVDGSGDVTVGATERLKASIGGAGTVRFRGNPKVEQSITGAGTIERE